MTIYISHKTNIVYIIYIYIYIYMLYLVNNIYIYICIYIYISLHDLHHSHTSLNSPGSQSSFSLAIETWDVIAS